MISDSKHSEFSLAARVQISPSVMLREQSGQAILLDSNQGSYFGLDEVGLQFWHAITSKASIQEAHAQLCEEYQIDSAVLEADLREWLADLLSRDLIVVIEPSEPR